MQKFIALAICLVAIFKLTPEVIELQRGGSAIIAEVVAQQSRGLSKLEAEDLYLGLNSTEYTGYDVIGILDYYAEEKKLFYASGEEVKAEEIEVEAEYWLEREDEQIIIKKIENGGK